MNTDQKSTRGRKPRSTPKLEDITGSQLIKRIRNRQNELSLLDDKFIYEGLGISKQSWSNMLNGNRRISSICKNPSQLTWMSNFLNIPPFYIRILAEELDLSELAVPFDLRSRLQQQMASLNNSNDWCIFAHEPLHTEFDSLPLKTRLLIVSLFNRVEQLENELTLINLNENKENTSSEPNDTLQAIYKETDQVFSKNQGVK